MTEEQIVNEIQFMRMWDKYLQKMLGKEKHSELSLGFARMLTSAELKSFGASDEEIEKACNFADMMAIADEHKADTPQNEQMKTADYCDICKQDMCKDCIADTTNPYCVPSHYEINYEPKDEPQKSCSTCGYSPQAPSCDTCEGYSNWWSLEDEPQTESTGSPIGDYRDGVGAWQTDCDDRYAIRTDSGEVVAHVCPLGCEQTDCGWK